MPAKEHNMKKRNNPMVRVSARQLQPLSGAELAALARMNERDIDTGDIAPADFSKAKREPKELISLRMDKSILRFFREQGPGYQGRIRKVLQAYVSVAHKRGSGRVSG